MLKGPGEEHQTARILILGGSGALGTAFIEALKGDSEIFAPGHSEVDIALEEDVVDLFSKTQPEIVINCAAFTDVDRAEVDREACWKTNVVGVKNICTHLLPDAKYVHMSTLSIPRFRWARPLRSWQKDNWYNLTKQQGEKLAKRRAQPHSNTWIFRPYWLWGDDSGFARNFLDRLLEGKEVVAVADAWGPMSYTGDVVNTVLRTIKTSPQGGTFQATFRGRTSPYKFAKFLAMKIGANPDLVIPISASKWFQSAPRPRVVRSMVSHQFRRHPHWRRGLEGWLGL